MTEYRIVNNEGNWQKLASIEQAIEAQNLGYNVLITEPPTPGGRVITPGSEF